MPTAEGSIGTGWLVLFSADETKRIAQGVSEVGGLIVPLSILIPEPYLSKAIAAGTAVLIFLAKKAAQKNRALGLYVYGANPYRVYRQYWQFFLKPSDAPRNLYALYSRLGFLYTPLFVYREEDPQSLESWRRAFGM